MGVDLFGKTVSTTYDSLIKVGDNDTLTSSAKRLSDGRGNDSAIWLSTTNMGINAAPTAGYTLTVNGNILGTKIDATTFQILGGTGTQGTLYWDSDENTVDLIQNGTTLEIGQQVEVNVKNQTLATIPKGTPVYVTGTLGASGRLTVAPFIADGSIDGKYFLGVTAEEIINGEDGKLLTFGKIRGLDTSAYSEGDTLFISDTTAGAFTTTAPTSPSLVFEIAIVITSHANNGLIFVRTGGTTSAGSTLQDVTDNGNTTDNVIAINYGAEQTGFNGNSSLRISRNANPSFIQFISPNTEQQAILFGDLDDSVEGSIRYYHDGDYMMFETNNAERVRITSAGQVGIGVTSPSGILHLSEDAPTIAATSENNVSGLRFNVTGTAIDVYRLQYNGNTFVNIRDTGNVGIGVVPSASSKLHVKDDDGAEIRIEDNNSTTFEILRLKGDSSTYEKYLIGYNSANTFSANNLHLVNTGGDIIFRADTGGGTGTERVRITGATGRVGIGTTNPQSEFVVSNSGAYGFEVDPYNQSNSVRLLAYDRSVNTRVPFRIDGEPIIFQKDAANELARLAGNGSLGIGTNAPNASTKLHVYDTDGAEIRIEDPTSTTFQILRFVGDASTYTKGLVGYNSANTFSANNLWLFNAGGDIVLGASAGGGTAIERVRITDTGNVGIGTTSPSSILHLSSAAPIITGTATNNSSGLRFNLSGTASQTFRFQYNGTTQVTVMSSGNVGIGVGNTPNAAAKLHVKDDDGAEIRIEDNTTTTFQVLRFVGDASTQDKYIIGYNSANVFAGNDLHVVNTGGDIVFRADTGGGTGAERVRIGSDGDFGINSSAPSHRLHVVEDNINIAVFGQDAANTRYIGLGANSTTGTATITAGSGSTQNVDLSIFTATGGSESEKVRIKHDGNVGIGTISPLRILDVRGASSTGGNFFLVDTTSGTTGTGGGVIFGSDAGNGVVISTASISGIKENSTAGNQQGALVFMTKDSSAVRAERMRLDSSGFLGLGTSSPASEFHISADAPVFTATSTNNASGLRINIDGTATRILRLQYNGSTIHEFAPDGDYAAIGSDARHTIQNGSGIEVLQTGHSAGGGGGFLSLRNDSNTQNVLFRGYGDSFILNNLGIGTSTPYGVLEVKTTGANNQILLTQGSTDHMILLAGTAGAGVVITENNYFAIWHQPFANRTGQTNLTERLRLTSTGNLGIGVTSPAARLHIGGGDMFIDGVSGSAFSHSIIFRTTSTASDVGIRSVGEGFEIYEPEDSNKVWFRILDDPAGNSAAALLNSAAGLTPILTEYNVSNYVNGTYITSYITKTFIDSLNVDADTLDGYDSTQILTEDGGSFTGTLTGSSTARITIENSTDASLSSTGHAFQIGATNSTNLIIDNNEILARSNGSTSPLFINWDGGDTNFGGSVGIGTSGPAYTLDVNGTFAFRSTGYLFNSQLYGYDTSTGTYLQFYNNSGIGYLTMTGSQNIALQTNGGNVGVGTTSPNAPIDVNGVIRSRGGSYSSGIDTRTDAGLVIQEDDFIYGEYSGNYLRTLIGITGGNIRIGQTGTGLIGDIILQSGSSGNIKFFTDGGETMRLDSSSNLHVDADIIGYSTTTSSDIKLKQNISNIENPLELVNELQGVHFEWKRDGKKSLGFIAQNVEKVLPELVTEVDDIRNEGETYKTVNYPVMVAILNEAIKEQQKQIEDLKAEIKHIKGLF